MVVSTKHRIKKTQEKQFLYRSNRRLKKSRLPPVTVFVNLIKVVLVGVINSLCLCAAFLGHACPGACLESEQIIRLKKAGVGPATLQALVEEKSIETCAFSVEEIVQLKKAGVSEETLQVLIREGSFLKDSRPRIYGKEIRSIEFTTARDIIELKEAGISDEIIRAIIISVSRKRDVRDRERAWEMLKNMGIIVDKRK